MIVREVLTYKFDFDSFDYFNDFKDTIRWLERQRAITREDDNVEYIVKGARIDEALTSLHTGMAKWREEHWNKTNSQTNENSKAP